MWYNFVFYWLYRKLHHTLILAVCKMPFVIMDTSRAGRFFEKMNYLKKDITNKTVSVIKENFKPEFHELIKDGFVCEGGFGCLPDTNGESIYGHWVSNKEDDKISGRDVLEIKKTPSPENV